MALTLPWYFESSTRLSNHTIQSTTTTFLHLPDLLVYRLTTFPSTRALHIALLPYNVYFVN